MKRTLVVSVILAIVISVSVVAAEAESAQREIPVASKADLEQSEVFEGENNPMI